jgi:hypothetical protein
MKCLSSALTVSHCAALFCALNVARADDPKPASKNVQAPQVRPGDVESAKAIVAAVYDVISGPAGAARDWNRFRSLFVQGARLIPVVQPPDKPAAVRAFTVEEFIDRADASSKNQGFYEREVSRREEVFSHMAHVFSTYESRRSKEDAPFSRGINSFQLFYDGTRWWVVTIFWDSERPESPLPARYLPAS